MERKKSGKNWRNERSKVGDEVGRRGAKKRKVEINEQQGENKRKKKQKENGNRERKMNGKLRWK